MSTMWDEVHEKGETQYIQKHTDVYMVVKQGPIGWLWRLYDQDTHSLLALSKTASMAQEPAFQEAEHAFAEAVEQLSQGVPRWSLALSAARGNPAPQPPPFIAIAAQDVVAPLQTLDELEVLIQRELERVRRDPNHTLAPYRRLVIYDALGPTAVFPTAADRVAQVQSGTLRLTRADRVRAQLALLTAKRVLPIWDTELAASLVATPREVEMDLRYMLDVLVEYDLPPALSPPLQALLARRPVDYLQLQTLVNTAAHGLPATQAALLHELIAGCLRTQAPHASTCLRLALHPNLVADRLIGAGTALGVARTEVPRHTYDLALALFRGTVPPQAGLRQSVVIGESFGTHLGWEEGEVSARALDSAMAAYEALQQVLGFGPFHGVPITPDTLETDVFGDGAAAAAAIRAESGIFDDGYLTNTFDSERQHRFWTWWLTEALPTAWRAEMERHDEALPVRPFRETVRPHRRHVMMKPRNERA